MGSVRLKVKRQFGPILPPWFNFSVAMGSVSESENVDRPIVLKLTIHLFFFRGSREKVALLTCRNSKECQFSGGKSSKSAGSTTLLEL